MTMYPESKVVLVYSDEGDWVGLYLDHNLVLEGHSLPSADVIETMLEWFSVKKQLFLYAFPKSVLVAYKPVEWFPDGHCPPKIDSEVVVK